MSDLDYISHEGVAHDENPPGRGSGRFGWGSGANPHQHQEHEFYYKVQELRQNGLTDREITDFLIGKEAAVNTMKARYSLERSAVRKLNYEKAMETLKECNYNYSEAARKLGYPRDTSLRSFLVSMGDEKKDRIENTINYLKEYVKRNMDDEHKGMVDVGAGAEYKMNVTKSTKDVALEALRLQGYTVEKVFVKQYGTGKYTTMLVLAPPGTTKKEIVQNMFHVANDFERSPDQGIIFTKVQQPTSISSDRITVRYAEDGGKEMDGVIEIRRGLKDLNLGGENYAQVRIAVDDTHYLKGMCVYGDNMPKGVDIIFNTNKTKDVPMMGDDSEHSVLKKLKPSDKDNPSAIFGATIKPNGQYYYIDDNGNKKLSPLNKINNEGDWDDWSRKLSTQFLSKQGEDNVKLLTEYTLQRKGAELDEIKRLTNPVLKKKLLDDYAEQTETNSVDLKTMGLRGQSYQVLLPVKSLKDNEVYAPNYINGERVALIRYPHQGIFEIPILTVNNNNSEARARITPGARDAIGINSHVAERLSGADFDGDTATVLPLDRNQRFNIHTMDRLKGLDDFDYISMYRLPDDHPGISDRVKQTQMGITTNLIQDMSLSDKVTTQDLEKATKHAMVVIDCKKHRLDYKASERDNDIQSLKEKYQTVVRDDGTVHIGGGATIITKAAKKHNYIPEVKEITSIKYLTEDKVKEWNSDKYNTLDDVKKAWARGDRILVPTNKVVDDRKEVKVPKNKSPEIIFTPEELAKYNNGKKVYRTVGTKLAESEIKPMYLVDDATELVRDKKNGVEMAYARYANNLKDLAREARKASRSIETYSMDKSAKKLYSKEVDSLNKKLRIAKENEPRERAAQAYSHVLFKAQLENNPDMDKEHRKKAQNQCLQVAREQLGAKKKKIEITPKEWEAIQARAISATKLADIFQNADPDILRDYATPKENVKLTDREKSLIKTLKANGETNADIAKALGCSTSTVSRIANE